MSKPRIVQKKRRKPVRQSVQLKKEAQRKAFLKAFAKCGNIFRACEKSGVGRRTHYDWLAGDERYAATFGDLKEQWVEVLEAEADRRGKEGVKRPVFYKGEICGHVREFSDVLLIVRLKALAPDKYRERQEIEHGGRIASTVIIETVDPHGVGKK